MAGELVLAASSDDQGIFATDLHSGALVATFDECSAQPAAFGAIGTSSGHIFAVQTKKALWHVWAWGERRPCYRASLPERTSAMAFTADAALCIAGAASGMIYVWQLGTGCLLRSWPAHFREVTQLIISQDESFLVSASADSTVHVYNLADIFAEQTPRPFHSWSGHALSVTSLAQLPGSGLQQTVVSASLDRSVRIWDVGTGQPLATRTLPAPVLGLCASPSGSEVICACGDGELRSLSLTAGSTQRDAGQYTGHTGAVLGCALSADGSRLASCGEADRVRVWETRTRQCISQVHANRNVQIGGVRIVRRSADSPSLPAFQPFQRLLTAPEEAPAAPLCIGGRGAGLEEELQERSRADAFIDRVIWSQASGMQALARAEEVDAKLAAAQGERARWAAVAAELYDELASCGALEPSPNRARPSRPPAAGAGGVGGRADAHKAAAPAAASPALKPTEAAAAAASAAESEDEDQAKARAPLAPRKRKRKQHR